MQISEKMPDSVNTFWLPWLCRTFTRSSGETTKKYLPLMVLELVVKWKKFPVERMW